MLNYSKTLNGWQKIESESRIKIRSSLYYKILVFLKLSNRNKSQPLRFKRIWENTNCFNTNRFQNKNHKAFFLLHTCPILPNYKDYTDKW